VRNLVFSAFSLDRKKLSISCKFYIFGSQEVSCAVAVCEQIIKCFVFMLESMLC